ncbi:MAG: DsbC family protein [Gammaproteobacteria bacterium]
MKLPLKITALLCLALGGHSTYADELAVRQALQKAMPSAAPTSIKPSEVKGLYEITMGATIFYMSEDGKYLLQGRLFDIEAKRDLTEAKMASVRKKALDSLGQDQMIIFKPEQSRYKVSVFTDIDCGYCRKLHSEIDQYMAEGITIQYLFFPRAGKGSESYKKAVSVWCSEDRNAALTAAKKGDNPEEKTCPNPVDTHMKLGAEFEARGTPMIVTEKGTIYPGYLPAKQLAEVLKEEQGL